MTAGLAPAEISRHKCLVYDGHPAEQLPVVVPLLLDSLRDHYRCLYLGSPDTIAMIDAALAARGVDTAAERGRGALVFSSDRSYLVGGRFDADGMVAGLRAAIDEAVSQGFAGLFATGDMRWELGHDDANFLGLLEYESKLEQVFRDKPLRGVCQYHRDTVPQHALRDALVTHRAVYVGHELNRDNLFYVPPETVLAAPGAAERTGEWMSQQILRVLKAEQARDRAMAALEDANRGLERRVAERTAELEAANRHLEAFAYAVSHDLRAPLRAIGGFSEILANEHAARLGAEGERCVARVRGGVKQMQELIDGMLALSRVMQADLSRGPVDLSALASDIVRDIQDRDSKRAAEFVIRPGMSAAGDRVLLRVLLTNLIENAWKFTGKRERARIEVGRRDAGGEQAFYVRDNGDGFDPKYAERLFRPFQRLHHQEDFPGTGIGLATAQRVVERHGGRIWAEARLGQGATFFFTLP